VLLNQLLNLVLKLSGWRIRNVRRSKQLDDVASNIVRLSDEGNISRVKRPICCHERIEYNAILSAYNSRLYLFIGTKRETYRIRRTRFGGRSGRLWHGDEFPHQQTIIIKPVHLDLHNT